MFVTKTPIRQIHCEVLHSIYCHLLSNTFFLDLNYPFTFSSFAVNKDSIPIFNRWTSWSIRNFRRYIGIWQFSTYLCILPDCSNSITLGNFLKAKRLTQVSISIQSPQTVDGCFQSNDSAFKPCDWSRCNKIKTHLLMVMAAVHKSVCQNKFVSLLWWYRTLDQHGSFSELCAHGDYFERTDLKFWSASGSKHDTSVALYKPHGVEWGEEVWNASAHTACFSHLTHLSKSSHTLRKRVHIGWRIYKSSRGHGTGIVGGGGEAQNPPPPPLLWKEVFSGFQSRTSEDCFGQQEVVRISMCVHVYATA